MALSRDSYIGDGSNSNFVVTFPYLAKAHVKVFINGVEDTTYTWLTSSTLQTTSVPPSMALVFIARTTPTTPLTDFVDGSTLTEALLDTATIQALYVSEETRDILEANLQLALEDNVFDGLNKRISNVADPVDPQDVATKSWSEASGTSFVSQCAAFASSAASSAASALSSLTSIGSYFSNLASSVGSAAIGFIQSGTGAIARTVQDKARETVSVKDFGAVGDGVTDDTASIQAAIDAVGLAGGGTVYFPAGTYAVGKTSPPYNPAITGSFDRDVIIDIQSDNITLKGAGRGSTVLTNTIANTTQARMIKIGRRIDGVNYVDDVSVQDMTIIGTYITGTPSATVATTGIDVSGLNGVGCTNIKLERLEIKNFAGYGIGFQRDGFINCIISDVQIQDVSSDGIDFKMDTNNSGYGNLVEKVTVLRFGLGTNIEQAGVDVRTGVSVRDVYVAEYGGALGHVGVRINNSIDTTESQQSTINNARCICTGGSGTKGVQFSGLYGRYSNIYCIGAEINYWVRSRKSQFNNLVSIGATQGLYIFANEGNAINNNVFANVYVTGATTGIILAGSGADLVENTFINAVAENNTTNVSIGSGVLRTTFVGGTVTGVSDSGTGTQILGTGGTAGPVRLGRSNTQHWLMSGDGSFNNMTAVNPAGTARSAIIRADENSGELRLYTLANQDVVIYRNNAVRLRITDLEVRPGNDNLTSSGSAAARWSTIYAGTGTINTSDSRLKQQIQALDGAEVAVAKKLKTLIRRFKFNEAVETKGDKARIHFGVLAQEVKEAFESEGLVAEEYALLCHDVWEETPELKDEEGVVIQEFIPAGERYGVRYEELLTFIVGAM